jgi:anti-sigma factor RsiW
MDCKPTLKQLSAYRDGELDASDLLSVSDHLDVCAACRLEYGKLESLSALVKEKVPRHEAPVLLAERIAASLPQAPVPVIKARRWNWLGAGAAFASLLAVTWGLNLYFAQTTSQQQLTEAVLASHVRSLQASHLADVASSDQHTVKPWFNGKLDFSPTALDYTRMGFPLVDGRLDYFDRRAVAVLVYRHRLHTINLFIWSGGGTDAKPRQLTLRGYHLVNWTADGMKCCAVSYLAPSELARFAGIVRGEGV